MIQFSITRLKYYDILIEIPPLAGDLQTLAGSLMLKLVSHLKWHQHIEEYHQTSCVVEISDDTFSTMFDLDSRSIG
jgi:hypothetical protein